MLHRFHLPRPYVAGESLELSGEELHHASHVVRLRAGEEVELFDGRGAAARATAIEVTRSRVTVRVDELLARPRELPFPLTLAAALIHPDKFELVLQKGTELGVTRFVPLVSERVEIRLERVAGKRERWERIILEATKQSGRAVLAPLDDPRSFREVAAAEGVRLLFDADLPPADLPHERIAERGATLLIGPEGGWSDEELAYATAHGALTQRLGPRRLRAETAAIAAIVTLSTQLGLFR